jgi:cytochrome c-type biogenesis protein CcmH
MTESSEKPVQRSANPARWALIGAAVIALAAAGFAIFKPKSSGPGSVAQPLQPETGSAIAALEAKLKDKPNDAEGWRMLGWSLFETGKFAEASQAYARATQIDPKKAEYWSSLGESLVLAGKGDVGSEAKAAFEKANGLDPKDPRARYFLAVAKDIAGDHIGAIDDWLALLADTPPGAPWEADVRKLVSEVGKKEKIEVKSRLAALRPTAAAGGAAVATAAIPGPTPEQMRAATGMPKGQQDMMIQGMVDGLEAKLKANPANTNGWIMLIRSRMQLGESAKASAALASARKALATNASALAQINQAAVELGVS